MSQSKSTSLLPRLAESIDSKFVVDLVRDNIIWPLLILVFAAFSLLIPIFATWNNILALLYGSAALGAVALAETVCLLSGHFDLSVGSITGFTAITTGVFLVEWFPTAPGIAGIVFILALGGLIGLLNGISVGYIEVNPFLQTLSFLIIFRGGIEFVSTSTFIDLPESYTYVGGGILFGIPVALLVIGVLIVVMHLLLTYSTIGRHIYAVGSDKDAAEGAGIDVRKTIVLVYVTSGVLSGLAGLLYTGYIGAASPTIGHRILFPAFAAAIIGGVSLFGGSGKVTDAAGGILLLGTIQVGLTLLNIDPTVINVINGVILLGAILLYTLEERAAEFGGGASGTESTDSG